MKKLLMIACLVLMASCDKGNDDVAIEAVELETIEASIKDSNASRTNNKKQINNLTVNYNDFVTTISWKHGANAEFFQSTKYRLKGSKYDEYNTWKKPINPSNTLNTYGFHVKQRNFTDRTYQIRMTNSNGEVDTRKVRMFKVKYDKISKGKVVFKFRGAKFKFKNKAVFVGKDNVKGVMNSVVISSPNNAYYESKVTITLNNRHKIVAEEDAPIIWFKKSITIAPEVAEVKPAYILDYTNDNSKLLPFIKEFVKDANANGYVALKVEDIYGVIAPKAEIKKLDINFGGRTFATSVASCNNKIKNGNVPAINFAFAEYWWNNPPLKGEKYQNAFRKRIIYHELGHSFLGYNHVGGYEIMGAGVYPLSGFTGWNDAAKRFFSGENQIVWNACTGKVKTN